MIPLSLANAVSLAGNVVMTVAIPWLVLTTSGSAALAGLVIVAGAAGAIVGGLVAGRVVDLLGPVRASAAADLLSGLSIVPLALLVSLGSVEIWQVVGLTMLGTLVDSTGSTARQGLVPAVADRNGRSRERANAMFTSAEHAGYLLGAPLAGLLLVGVGVGRTLWITTGLFVVAAVIVLCFVAPPTTHQTEDMTSRVTVRDALAFIWSDTALRALVVFPTLAVGLVGPLVPIVLPVLARQVYDDPIVLGLMVAAYGIGGLLGTAGYGVVGPRVSRRLLYRVVFVVWPSAFAAIALVPVLPVTMAALLVLGSAAGALVPLQATIRQERSPAVLLPRVVGLSTATIPVVAPFGVLVTGMLIDGLGLTRTLMLMTAAAAVLGLIVVTGRTTQAFEATC